jgi:hypothetical protein
LVGLFGKLQRGGFLQALSVAAGLRPEHDELETVLAEIGRRLTRYQTEDTDEFDTLAVELQAMTGAELRAVRDQLRSVLAARGVDGRIWVDVDTADTAMWYRGQRIDLARQFGYFADFGRYNHWGRLKVELDSRFDVLVSFTAVGSARGTLAAVVGALESSTGGDAGQLTRRVHVVSQEPFTATSREQASEVRGRFRDWLRTDVARALARWQRGL